MIEKLIKRIIPRFIKEHLKLVILKRRFPNSVINSKSVALNVTLGRCVLYKGSRIGAYVNIGDYSFVNIDTIIFSAVIGKFTSIAPRCQIGMPEHPVDHMSTSPYIYSEGRSVINISSWTEIYTPPIIGNDVWIGANSVVLQGVKIGDGAIIGAGAVVTKDVESYSIVGGVPARLIRKRFDEKTIQYLLDLKWWDMPNDEIKKYKELFESGSEWENLTGYEVLK